MMCAHGLRRKNAQKYPMSRRVKGTKNTTIKASTVVPNKNATGDRDSVTAMATTSLTMGNQISAVKTLPERPVAMRRCTALLFTIIAKQTEMFCVTRCAKITIARTPYTKMPIVNRIMHLTNLFCMELPNMETSLPSICQVNSRENACMRTTPRYVQVCPGHGGLYHRRVTTIRMVLGISKV